jgi:hypothetical protein
MPFTIQLLIFPVGEKEYLESIGRTVSMWIQSEKILNKEIDRYIPVFNFKIILTPLICNQPSAGPEIKP